MERGRDRAVPRSSTIPTTLDALDGAPLARWALSGSGRVVAISTELRVRASHRLQPEEPHDESDRPPHGDRADWTATSASSCWPPMSSVASRLSRAGRAAIFPVNYVLDGDTIVFRTDPGTKLGAAGRARASFEIDSVDREHRTGWSVVASGRLEEVTRYDASDLQPARVPARRSLGRRGQAALRAADPRPHHRPAGRRPGLNRWPAAQICGTRHSRTVPPFGRARGTDRRRGARRGPPCS